MLQKLESDSSSSGERPTRAVPLSVRKSPSALRLATGRGERTRIGPRGVITKWSERDELFRFPNGGDPEWRTRPRHAGIVATKGVSVRMQMGKSDLLRTCLSGSESKIATVADRGNYHDVEAGMVQRKTGQYKCTKSVPGSGGAAGFAAFFGELSISRIRLGSNPPLVWSQGVTSYLFRGE